MTLGSRLQQGMDRRPRAQRNHERHRTACDQSGRADRAPAESGVRGRRHQRARGDGRGQAGRRPPEAVDPPEVVEVVVIADREAAEDDRQGVHRGHGDPRPLRSARRGERTEHRGEDEGGIERRQHHLHGRRPAFRSRLAEPRHSPPARSW